MTRMRCQAAALGLGLLFLAGRGEPALAALRFQPVGPLGGDVRSLAQDPRDPRRVYAGTVDGMIYVSLNAGASWTRLDPGFPLRDVSLDDLLVTETGEVLASFWKIDGTGGGVALSLDLGKSFQMIGAGLFGEVVRGLARAPSNPRVFVAVTKTGVFRSSDEAETFSRISPANHPDLQMVGSVAIDPRNENSILVGTAHLAWRTDNGGRSWRPIQQGMIDDSDVMTLTLDRRSPSTVFATACTGIWRSLNAGTSWTKVLGIPSVSRRTRAFAQDHNRPDTFYAGTTDGVYVSDDDAKTFARTTPPGLVVNALLSLGGGRVLAGVEGEGMLVSTDFGRSWKASNDGFRERLVRQIVPDGARGRILVLTGADGPRHSALFEKNQDRESWRRIDLPEGRQIRTLGVLEDGDLILGADDGVYRGPSSGSLWSRLPLYASGVDPHPDVADLHIRGSQILIASDQGLFQSRDRGTTWTLIRLGASRSVAAIAVSSTGRIVAATPLAIHASEGGRPFQQIAAVGLRGLKALDFAPGSDTRIVASTSQGLFVSPDAGKTWFDTSAQLGRVTALSQHPNGRTIFVADAILRTIFVSEDGGQTFWPIAAEGLPSQRTFAMALAPSEREGIPPRLLVAASGGGLLEAVLDDPLPPEIEKR